MHRKPHTHLAISQTGFALIFRFLPSRLAAACHEYTLSP